MANPIAEVKSELQPKSFLDDAYYFDLYDAIINYNNETFEFYPTYQDAESKTNPIVDLISNFSTLQNEIFIRVTTQNGCYKILKVILLKPPVFPDSVSLPNAFTPNNDGVNDKWDYSLLSNFQNVGLNIYDKSGKLLYTHTKDFYWDGKFNNQKLPTDSYWVVYQYTSKGAEVKKNMWVLLSNTIFYSIKYYDIRKIKTSEV